MAIFHANGLANCRIDATALRSPGRSKRRLVRQAEILAACFDTAARLRSILVAAAATEIWTTLAPTASISAATLGDRLARAGFTRSRRSAVNNSLCSRSVRKAEICPKCRHGPSFYTFDLNVTREWKMGERMRLRPVIEFDNILNAAVFSYGAEFIDFTGLTSDGTARPPRKYLPDRISSFLPEHTANVRSASACGSIFNGE